MTLVAVLICPLAGMLLSVTGVVFSITMLTLSQTSSQFGSRLLRTFLNQNITQFTLGVFLAAGIYALLILRTVRSSTDSPSTPHLSVALAVVMVTERGKMFRASKQA